MGLFDKFGGGGSSGTMPPPSAPTGSPSSSPTVEKNGSGGPPATPAAPVHAGEIAPEYGGLRGGRAREDGLVPGSAEAVEADKKKDRERKKRERAAKRAEPAALPSAAPGSVQATPGSPGLVSVPAEPAPIPWTAEDVQPAFNELVPFIQERAQNQIAERAAAAKLPEDLQITIAESAEWPAITTDGILRCGPEVTAKWLTQLKVSAENKWEVGLVAALASAAAHHYKILKRLDKLIALHAKQKKQNETLAAEPQENQIAD